MAEATTQISITPKQLGKHLRTIRRKKGLSLSEVARGAGLSRRELVAYERGKVAIPESDLWVLAGSCGVDVSELTPRASTHELTEAANSTSVGDTVSQLRRSQEDAGVTAYLHTLQKLQALPAGKRIPVKERELEEIATALGSTPRSIEQKLQEVLNVSPDEAERLRAMILVSPSAKGRPRALAAAPSALPAPAPALAAAPVAAPAPPPPPPVSPFADVPTPTPFAPPAPPAPPAPAEPPEPPETTPVPTVETPEPEQAFPIAPAALLDDDPFEAPADGANGNIDIFEELARLPEPVPLADPSEPVPDLLAPQDPFANPLVPAIGLPDGAVELVDSSMPSTPAVAGAAAWTAAADAPPIDVAMRQGSSTWDLGEPPLVAKHSPATDPTTWETDGWQPPAPDGGNGTTAGFWEGTDDWAPTGDPAGTTPSWTEPPETLETFETPGTESPLDEVAADETLVIGEATWAGSAWDPEPWSPVEAATTDAPPEVNPWAPEWPSEPADRGAWDHTPDPAAVDSGFYVDWGTPETDARSGDDGSTAQAAPETTANDEFVEMIEVVEADAVVERVTDDVSAWDSWSSSTTTTDEQDPPAPVSHDDTFDAAATIDAAGTFETGTFETGTFETGTFETGTFETSTFEPETDETSTFEPETDETWDTWSQPAASSESTPFVASADGTVELTPISWRAEHAEITEVVAVAVEVDAPDAPDAPDEIVPADVTTFDDWILDAAVESAPETTTPEPEPEPEPGIPTATEEFVTAGSDWQLGNALPLVEVQSQGGLVMRRADERWALADVTTTPDFVAEVEVDFRSGPGLGVLFRASTDDEGRMSGYSFDIDPIYDGGGYLVRQWHADRELWNPIARVNGDDPAAMYGTLLVRIEVTGEQFTATINGVEVLTVANLKQASVDRGRDGASGDRVGVQAWSSSDLVIETVRVAAR